MHVNDIFIRKRYISQVFTQAVDDNNPMKTKAEIIVLTFNDVDVDANKVERSSHKKHFLPRVEMNMNNYIKF